MKSNKNFIFLNLFYNSSYSNLTKFFFNKNKNLIYYKNYLYFFLILKYFFFNISTIKIISIKLRFEKKKKNFKVYLNSPNRHKISLTKLKFKFYSFNIHIKFFLYNLFFKNFISFFYLISLFNNLFSFFESYLFTLKKKSFYFFLYLNYNILLK